MGLLAVFCSSYPDSRLAIAFIPNFDFSADTVRLQLKINPK